MWAIEAMQLTQGRSDTYDDPHKTEAVPTAA